MTTHVPIEVRIARFAARLSPDEAAYLLCSWDYHKTQHTSDELEELFASYRLDRELKALLLAEQQRVFDEDLAEGDDI
jgi:hypothetical protein